MSEVSLKYFVMESLLKGQRLWKVIFKVQSLLCPLIRQVMSVEVRTYFYNLLLQFNVQPDQPFSLQFTKTITVPIQPASSLTRYASNWNHNAELSLLSNQHELKLWILVCPGIDVHKGYADGYIVWFFEGSLEEFTQTSMYLLSSRLYKFHTSVWGELF